MVHLRMCTAGASARTLCDAPIRLRPPTRLFQQAGCPECARLAVAAGIGYVREGVKRRAYRKDGEWVDAVLFALTQEDLD